jgi:hypothetical protein
MLKRPNLGHHATKGSTVHASASAQPSCLCSTAPVPLSARAPTMARASTSSLSMAYTTNAMYANRSWGKMVLMVW